MMMLIFLQKRDSLDMAFPEKGVETLSSSIIPLCLAYRLHTKKHLPSPHL